MIDIREKKTSIYPDNLVSLLDTLAKNKYEGGQVDNNTFFWNKSKRISLKGKVNLEIVARSCFIVYIKEKKVEFEISLTINNVDCTRRDLDCFSQLENILTYFINKDKSLKYRPNTIAFPNHHEVFTKIETMEHFDKFFRLGNEYLKTIERFKYRPKRGVLKV